MSERGGETWKEKGYNEITICVTYFEKKEEVGWKASSTAYLFLFSPEFSPLIKL